MGRFCGWILAGGLVLGLAGTADAQVALSIGNPYTGTGFSLGVPGIGSYGMAPYAASPITYSSGYAGYAPITYSSGYAGYVAPAAGYLGTGYYGAPALTSVYPSGYTAYGSYGWPSIYSPLGYGYGGWGWSRGGLLGRRLWRW